MAEYIDREKVGLTDFEIASCNGDYKEGLKLLIHKIESIPAADVRPVVRAVWYGEADGYADGELVYDMWSCPICGKRFEEWEEKPDWNFCPNCGADMRGGENNG